MRRRTVLATLSALLAGCTGATDPDDGSTATISRRTTATTSTETTTTATTTRQPYALLPPDPASMTADEVGERLDGRDCTTLSDLPMTCPGDDGQLDVSVSSAVVDLAGGTAEFTVENRADEAFQWRPWRWVLQKWSDSRWHRITPQVGSDSLGDVSPDESYTYRITSVESEGVLNQYHGTMPSEVTVGGLGPGVYGFSIGGHFESTPDDEITVAGLFGLAGEAPPIVPTDAIADVKRDGSELVVHAYDSERNPTHVTVSLVDGGPDAELLPEHVHQLAALRNTLPYAATDGVESIRCVTNRYDARKASDYLSAVTPDGTTRYGFRDVTFEFSIEES